MNSCTRTLTGGLQPIAENFNLTELNCNAKSEKRIDFGDFHYCESSRSFVSEPYEHEERRSYYDFGVPFSYSTSVIDNSKFDWYAPVYFRAVCVDGLSGVGKSSLSKILERHSIVMKKPCKENYYPARNSHPASAIGYVHDFIKTMKTDADLGDGVVYDRLPINNIIWDRIWMMFGALERSRTDDYDNNDPSSSETDSDEEDLDGSSSSNTINEDFLKSDEKFHRIFKYTKFLDEDAMKMYGACSKNILVIDTDTGRARNRLAARNDGTDRDRSTWPYYIEVQNYAYRMLHKRWPERFYLVDLVQFDGDQDKMQDFLVQWVLKAFSFIKISPDSPFKFEALNPEASKDRMILHGDLAALRAFPLTTTQFSNAPNCHRRRETGKNNPVYRKLDFELVDSEIRPHFSSRPTKGALVHLSDLWKQLCEYLESKNGAVRHISSAVRHISSEVGEEFPILRFKSKEIAKQSFMSLIDVDCYQKIYDQGIKETQMYEQKNCEHGPSIMRATLKWKTDSLAI